MPTYVYNCPACGESVERIVKVDERDRQSCECGNNLSRQLTAGLPPVFRGVSGSCSMDASMRLPNATLTTDPR